MSGEALERAESRIKDLETRNKAQAAQIETLEEALAGAQRIVRQLRDEDSDLPPLDKSAPTP